MKEGSLANKRILIGVSGGIAAYKVPELVRCLVKQGAEVKVVLTKSAKQFVTPLTLQALTGEVVREALFDELAEQGMSHIELARWADLLVIAPATANIIAAMANGFADDLLSTLYLATTAPCLICPAMNVNMWQQAAVTKNLQQLQTNGVQIAGPATGEQACGDVGMGRMIEVSEIVEQIAGQFMAKCLLGKKVLITLGPTREYLDPIRYISNESSGKMGYSLALAALAAGAEVTVIAGPVNFALSAKMHVVSVMTAEQMHQAVRAELSKEHIFISAAAVCDYGVVDYSEQKIKKAANSHTIELRKNTDILAAVGLNQLCGYVVGFAAETHQLEHHAKQKLAVKKANLMIANQVGIEGQGFNSDDNQVSVFSNQGQTWHFEKMSKQKLAVALITLIGQQIER